MDSFLEIEVGELRIISYSKTRIEELVGVGTYSVLKKMIGSEEKNESWKLQKNGIMQKRIGLRLIDSLELTYLADLSWLMK